jgi:hypothetical protein
VNEKGGVDAALGGPAPDPARLEAALDELAALTAAVGAVATG